MIPSKINLNYMLMNVKKNTLITTWSYIMFNLSRIRWRWPRPNFHHLTLNAIHCSLHEFLLYDNIYVRICDYAAHEHGFISNLHIQAHVGLNPISKSNKTREYCPPPPASLHLFFAGSPQSAAIMACRWRNAMCLSDLLKIHTSECQIKVLGY